MVSARVRFEGRTRRMLKDLLMGQKGTTGGFALSLDLPTATVGLLQTEVDSNREAHFGGKNRSLVSGNLSLR